MRIEKTGGAWALWDDEGRRLGSARGMSFPEAVDAFAANWPGLAAGLDALRAADEELCGAATAVLPAGRRVGRPASQRRPGSGLRFRELIAGGATNAEALAAVRAEFPESRATLSDAAWNRARWQKEKAAREGGLEVDDLL